MSQCCSSHGRPVPEHFEHWMETSGRLRKIRGKRIPTAPMSPTTVKREISRWRGLMKRLGLMENPEKGVWKIVYGVNWRRISATQVATMLQQKYEGGNLTPSRIQNRNHDHKTLRKFGQFLHFHLRRPGGGPAWSDRKLQKLYEVTSLEEVEYEELEINDPAKAHAFQQWLDRVPVSVLERWGAGSRSEEDVRTGIRSYAALIFLGQWVAGIRYSEAVAATKELDAWPLKVDLRKKWVTVWGKGRGGKGKVRYAPLSAQAVEYLRELLKWRRGLDVGADTLLVNTDGRSFADETGTANRALRRLAEIYNDGLEDEGARLDLELVKTHAIGRHVYGTFYAAAENVSDKELMDWMGIKDHKVLRRYINFSKEHQVAQIETATALGVNGGNDGAGVSAIPAQSQPPVPAAANEDVLVEIRGLREELTALRDELRYVREERDELRAHLDRKGVPQ